MKRIFFFGVVVCLLSSALWASNYDAQTANESMKSPIQTDWRIQDFGSLEVETLFQTESNEREKACVQKVLAELKQRGAEVSESEKTLTTLQEVPGNDARWQELYTQVCQERRALRLETLRKAFPCFVFTKHFNLGGSHYAYTEGLSDAQAERQFVPGTALCLLECQPDGEFRQRDLIVDENGVIRDPVVTFDGRKIIFSWKKSDREDDYHLYEYDLDTDEIRQLTFGLGFADYEPCVLPNGEIIFNSTRCIQVVDCWWTEVSNLYRCDKDGKDLQRVSFDQVHTNYPSLLSDGRIIYTRWDYNDRGQIFPQGLFQMNADGTGQTECYGNNSWFPTTILHAREIPNSHKMVAILTGHHSPQRGKLAIIDTTKGRQEAEGVQLISPIRETKAERIDAWGQDGEQFQYPFALNEREFVVAYNPDCGGSRKYRTPFGIYYIDIDGNRELLAYDSRISSNQPFAVKVREAIPLRPSSVDESVDYGTYYVQDVFFGPGMQGVDRSRAKKIRVIGLEFRTVGIGNNGNHGPAGGAMSSTPVSIGQGTWDVKIPLGDATIYEDGSACFKVPARQPLYFQVLDEKGHCIQTMRSWSTLQPGENFSCLGCHEDKNTGTMLRTGITEAMKRGPQELELFYGSPRGFSFEKEIQPILDKHCIRCHQNRDKAPPFAVGKLAEWGKSQTSADSRPYSLLNEKNLDAGAKRYWSDSYLNLTSAARVEHTSGRATDVVNWLNIQAGPELQLPYLAGACRSRLLTMFDTEKPHNDVKLSREELDKLAFWIDALVPYCGDYTENNAWNEADWKKYEYYQEKQKRSLDGN